MPQAVRAGVQIAVRSRCQRAVRAAAVGLGKRLGVAPVFSGREADTARLIDSSRAKARFGQLGVNLDTRLDRSAGWTSRGPGSPGKPAHYEARGGNY